jgi:uncharacterized membrane protein
MKITKSCFSKIILLDFLLFLVFRHYQPICEPCIDGADCPPCLSEEQYFIIYFGLVTNLIFGMYCYYKNRKNRGCRMT